MGVEVAEECKNRFNVVGFDVLESEEGKTRKHYLIFPIHVLDGIRILFPLN